MKLTDNQLNATAWAIKKAEEEMKEHEKAIVIVENAMQSLHAKYLEGGKFYERLVAERDSHVTSIEELQDTSKVFTGLILQHARANAPIIQVPGVVTPTINEDVTPAPHPKEHIEARNSK